MPSVNPNCKAFKEMNITYDEYVMFCEYNDLKYLYHKTFKKFCYDVMNGYIGRDLTNGGVLVYTKKYLRDQKKERSKSKEEDFLKCLENQGKRELF